MKNLKMLAFSKNMLRKLNNFLGCLPSHYIVFFKKIFFHFWKLKYLRCLFFHYVFWKNSKMLVCWVFIFSYTLIKLKGNFLSTYFLSFHVLLRTQKTFIIFKSFLGSPKNSLSNEKEKLLLQEKLYLCYLQDAMTRHWSLDVAFFIDQCYLWDSMPHHCYFLPYTPSCFSRLSSGP